MSPNCPPPDQLKQLTLGDLPDPPASEVEAHLLECAACQQTTANLNVGDTFVDALRTSAKVAHAAAQSLDSGDRARVDRIISDLSGLQAHSGTSATQFASGESTQALGNTAPHVADELLAELALRWLPAQQPDELGRLGNYRVLRLLGAGGMGGVFLAEDIQLKRRVALKVMRPHVAATPGAAERFLREAQAAAAVRHDHVVTIFQVGQDHGVPFIAQELLSGETLEDRLQRNRQLPLAEAVSIARQTADGLATAHTVGLIHRDIKPANLWLETEHGGRVKILDFGLARALADDVHLTQSGTILGTPSYMAPEQARSEEAGPGCDLYSLGVVLYRMATGGLPFRANNTMAMLLAVMTQEPQPISELNANLPPELAELIMQLLAKESADRPPSAADVAERLGAIEQQLRAPQAGDNEPTTELPAINIVRSTRIPRVNTAARTRDAGAAERGLRTAARKRLALIVGAVALLVLVPVGFFFAGTVVRFATNRGEVVITTDDPNIEIAIKDQSGTIIDHGTKREYTVKAGTEHQVEVTVKDERGEVQKFATRKFTVGRGGKEVLRIELQLANQNAGSDILGAAPAKSIMPNEKKSSRPEPGESPVVANGDDRKAAEWVLRIGGKVNFGDRVIDAIKDVPAGTLQLQGIDLQNNQQMSDAGLVNLKGLTNLNYIDLRNPGMSDAGLVHLSGLTKLGNLYLGGTRVSDAGLVHLKGLANLKFLTLHHTQVSDDGLEHLKDLTNLTYLDLGATRVGDAGLVHLKGLNKLTHLEINGPGISDAGLMHLKGLNNLTELWLNNTEVSDAGLLHLKDLTNLRQLYLFSTQVSDVGLEHLKGLTNLTLLSLGNTQVSDAGLQHLKNLSQLTELHLPDMKVTAAGVAALEKALPKCKVLLAPAATEPSPPVATLPSADRNRRAAEWALECGGKVRIKIGDGEKPVTAAKDLPAGPFALIRVALNGCGDKVTDAGLENINGLATLTHLDMRGTHVTNAGLDHLKGLTELVDLQLSDTAVTDAGLVKLTGLLALRQLSVYKTGVTDAGLEHIKGMTGLTVLDLEVTQVTDAGLEHMKRLAELQVLGLAYTRVTDAGLERLKGLSELQKLNLLNTRVTDAGLAHLRELSALTHLDLGGTQVTATGLEHLKGLTKLIYLSVHETRIADAGLEKLKDFPALTQLVLGGSQLTDPGVEHFKRLSKLTALYVDKASLTPAVAEKLLKALPNCEIITY